MNPISEVLDRFIEEYMPNAKSRFASFDFCYAYFQRYKDNLDGKNMELSCLQLWTYLASWGMLRGSSELLQNNVTCMVPVIEHFSTVAKQDISMWDIDVDKYCESSVVDKLLSEYDALSNLLKEKVCVAPTVTLVTKIMLGVYGNIPAFDNYFRSGMAGISSVNKTSIRRMFDLYNDNREAFDRQISVIDFHGTTTPYCYPKAKLLDMYGFRLGQEKNNSNK